MTREEWLRNAAAELLADVVLPMAPGHAMAPLQISVGFPKGRHGRGRAGGQCWSPSLARDGAAHIFVSPERDGTEVLEILGTVTHELVHAVVGPDCGHHGPFRRLALAVGFRAPLTGSVPDERLSVRLNAMAGRLGPFPHGALRVPPSRAGSRLRLWECACGVKARVASDDFDATCNRCGGAFAVR